MSCHVTASVYERLVSGNTKIVSLLVPSELEGPADSSQPKLLPEHRIHTLQLKNGETVCVSY